MENGALQGKTGDADKEQARTVRTCFPGQWWLTTAIRIRTQTADVFSRKAAVDEGIVVRLMSSQAMQAKRKVLRGRQPSIAGASTAGAAVKEQQQDKCRQGEADCQ